MNGAGRALLLAALLLLSSICATNAQDTASLAGLNASLKGDVVLIELHTTTPAQFQVDRFTMGNWVTVWSRSFQSSGVNEIPLDFNRPELAQLVTGASLVTENSRPGIRFYLGPAAKRTSVFLMTKDDVTTVVIPPDTTLAATASDAADTPAIAEPAEPVAVVASAKPAMEPAATDGAFQGLAEATPALVPVEPSSAVRVESEHMNQIATQREPVDATPSGQGFYLPRQEPTLLANMPPTPDDEVAESAPAPELRGADNPPVQHIRVDSPPQVIAVERDTDGTPLSAQLNFQVPAGGLASDEKGSGADLGDVSLKDIIDQAAQSAMQVLGQPGGAAPKSQPAVQSSIGTPGGGSFYGAFQSQAEVSAKLDGVTPSRNGKEALSNIVIDLFEIIGTPLDQALTLLVAPTDYNIIVDADAGKNIVSLSFKDSQTDLKNALDLLTRTYGLDYIVDANTIVVASKDKINGQLVDYMTRVFVLSYADPKSVKDMLLQTAQLKEDQIEIYKGESEYLTVNDSTTLSEPGGSGSGGGGESGGGGSGTKIKQIESNLSSTPRNALLIKAVPSQMDQIAALVEQLDRQPQLIELEVRVCEVQENALKNLGISIQGNETDTPIGINSTWTEGGTDSDGASGAGVFEAFSTGSFYRNPLQFLATLNTQIQDRSVNVLAQPTLSTVEGKQAIYFAGETVPYISKVTQSPQGTQIEVGFLKLGVTLNFKPRLDADGKLTIDVNPIVSSLLEFRRIGDLMEAPRTSERQLATTVRVGDCEPFVLAGLISEEERKTVTKVPLLGDLPLVGKLFRNNNTNGKRTEIVIVVVPHIVN